MDEYQTIINKIKTYQKELESPSLSDTEKKVLEAEMGDLIDQAKRMTFHISCMEEDNYV
ncbi:MAG: hypothetical protein HFH60_10245 [Lachnospiraceae bacterium]|jgi:hypothetical protein|nr:hypothetical protein [Lachnospiraceae bacterium]